VPYEDRLRISTPEGLDLDLELAGVPSRFTAALLDWVIQAIPIIVVWAALPPAIGDLGVAIASIVTFLMVFVYDVLFEVLGGGRTPGKRANGLRVVTAEGGPVDLRTSATRNILRLVDLQPVGGYLVGIIAVIATKKNQRLGDIAARTIVVREARSQGEAAFTAPWVLGSGASWNVSSVTPAEVAAVRRFLDRRHELDREARDRLAETLSLRLRPKVLGAGEEVSHERFLEQVVAAKLTRG
jgi:uncharacterized RDD family membrane protein YckC